MRQCILYFILLCISSISVLAEAESKLVEICVVKKRELDSGINLIGIVSSKQESTLRAKHSGTLAKVFFEDTADVKQGTLIAQMENEDSLIAYQLAVKSEMIARGQYERSLELYSKHHITREALEEKKQKWYMEKQNLTKAKKALEDSDIKAPFSGKLSAFKTKQGSYLNAGDEIVTVYDPSVLQIDLSIPESIANKVKVGTAVSVMGKKLKITSIDGIIDKSTRMINARVLLPQIEVPAIIGNVADVVIIGSAQQNVLSIPKSSVFIKDGREHVFIVQDGTAKLTEVKIGNRGKEFVEILEGLKEGQQVVLFGQSKIFDGEPLRIYTDA